jgi:hypothetical protein
MIIKICMCESLPKCEYLLKQVVNEEPFEEIKLCGRRQLSIDCPFEKLVETKEPECE